MSCLIKLHRLKRESNDLYIEIHAVPKQGYTLKEKILRALGKEALDDNLIRYVYTMRVVQKQLKSENVGQAIRDVS